MLQNYGILISLSFIEAMASQPSSPANLSSDLISPTTVQSTAGSLHPGRHTSQAASSLAATSQLTSGGQTMQAAGSPMSGNLSTGVGGGSNGVGGPSSGGGVASNGGGGAASGGYNQQEVRYSGTELVMLYDYKVCDEQGIERKSRKI